MTGTTLSDRALLRLSGEDVRGFLQGLVTNDVEALAPGRPLWAGLLTAQGKALFDFILWADGDDVLIDCEAEQAEALARRLASIACAARSDRARASLWRSIGPSTATRACPTRALPRSAAAGSRLPATRPKAGSPTACRSA